MILASFTSCTTASSFAMITFAPVQSIIVDVYDVPATVVSSCVVFFLLSFIIFNFASISALENAGMAKTVSTTRR